MTKEKTNIQLFATDDGKLYIKPSDLFAREHVQQIIERMANSTLLPPKKQKRTPRSR